MSKYIITVLCFGFAATGAAYAHGGETHLSSFALAIRNSHPFWVHVPLVLLPLMTVVSIIALIRTKDEWLYLLGSGTFIVVVFTWFAEQSGHSAGEMAEHAGVSGIAIGAHEAAATWVFPIALLAFAASVGALWARRQNRFLTPILAVVVVLLGLSTAITIRAGHLGAILVYGHGAGVGIVFEASPQSPAAKISSGHLPETSQNTDVGGREAVSNSATPAEVGEHEQKDHSGNDGNTEAIPHNHSEKHGHETEKHTHSGHGH